MKLIAENDLKKVFTGKIKPKDKTIKLIMRLLKINQLNKLYEGLADKSDTHFFNQAINELGIMFDCSMQSLNNIPKSGPFIVIANHPFGGIDGILMLKILSTFRPDFKLIGNFLLQQIQPIKPYIIPVNPFENNANKTSSFSGMRQALKHLNNGNCLGIFPTGEVSAFNLTKSGISDKKWDNAILKFIKTANVPVVPLFFSGNNSTVFHTLGLKYPELRTAKLPSELFNKKDKLIQVTINNPISISDQDGFTNLEQYGRYLRTITYLPSSPTNIKTFYNRPTANKHKAEKISDPISKNLIQDELEKLKDKYLQFNHLNISVYCAPHAEMPLIIEEIGRLREITFRVVGEGTNNSKDIDEYDLYYWHLFLYDNAKEQIIGAYRIGKGEDIFKRYKNKGFYTYSLFKFKPEFFPVLQQSLELGRSFIIKDYQRQAMPLFLLWKGILYFLLKNKGYRYLLGPVSISNDYSAVSRSLIMGFIQTFYSNKELKGFIKPRKKFKVSGNKSDHSLLVNSTKGQINKLERIISHVEKVQTPVPILLKKYLKIGGKILDFNLDPKFNDCLDGLLLLDLKDIPLDFIASLSKEFNIDQSTIFSEYKHIV